MKFITKLLENREPLQSYFLYAIAALVALALINYVAMHLGKKIKALNNFAGMTSTLMMPISLVAILLGMLLGCAYAGLPWYISGLACAFLFIIGVGYILARSR